MNPVLIQLGSHFLKPGESQQRNEKRARWMVVVQSIEYRESVLTSKGRLLWGAVSNNRTIAYFFIIWDTQKSIRKRTMSSALLFV